MVVAEVKIYGRGTGGGRNYKVLHRSSFSLNRGLEREENMLTIVYVDELELNRFRCTARDFHEA